MSFACQFSTLFQPFFSTIRVSVGFTHFLPADDVVLFFRGGVAFPFVEKVHMIDAADTFITFCAYNHIHQCRLSIRSPSHSQPSIQMRRIHMYLKKKRKGRKEPKYLYLYSFWLSKSSNLYTLDHSFWVM